MKHLSLVFILLLFFHGCGNESYCPNGWELQDGYCVKSGHETDLDDQWDGLEIREVIDEDREPDHEERQMELLDIKSHDREQEDADLFEEQDGLMESRGSEGEGLERRQEFKEDGETCETYGSFCNPIVISQFPFEHSWDTSRSGLSENDIYSCAPDLDESGPEVVYMIDAGQTGVLTVRVQDSPENGVDVDIHLLSSPNPGDCITRANSEFTTWLDIGEKYFLVVDTYVKDGVPQAGPYTLTVGFVPAPQGDCTMLHGSVTLKWGTLALPATGPVVKEAHMVTTAEKFDGNGWPDNSTDGLARHIELSSNVTGFLADRTETWCPYGEGGSQWGQGSSVKPPLEYEAWYICMYWTSASKPDPGTRMIVTNPVTGRSVVAIAGYETGPGSSSAIAGVVEEVHQVLGTAHRSKLMVGFARDQDLDPGPVDCVQ
ncbi:MAG: hypothetical protein GXP49_16210 [Deltaproteobacteria bacterium]|nr:hypothetical protein [Deltaproteobacteria bacterium]